MSEDSYTEEGAEFGSIVLDFFPQAYARIQQIRGETEVVSIWEVIKNAVRFNEWCMKRILRGDYVRLSFQDSSVFLERPQEKGGSRVPVYLFNDARIRLQAIRQMAGNVSMQELINISLHRYDQYLAQVVPGMPVEVRTQDGYTDMDTLEFI